MPSIVLRSYHHLAAPDWRRYFHTVSRAGHLRASADYVIRRSCCIGQDILFCVEGAGWIESLGKKHKVSAHQLAWLANEHAHAHMPDSAHPWELLWVRLEGPGLTKLRALLFEQGSPIFIKKSNEVVDWFSRLFLLLEEETPGIEIRLHHLISELFCLIESGASESTVQETWLSFPDSLLRVIRAIRLHPEEKWSAARMALIGGVSPAQLRKLTARHLQMSPQQWLARERIAIAQNLLAENEDPVGEIAERCGYADIYHFSREFKRHTGLSPRAFRLSEKSLK